MGIAERPGWARDFNRPKGTETRRMRGNQHPCERSRRHGPKTGRSKRSRVAAWARPPQDEAHRARRKDLQRPVPAVRREAHDIVLRLLPRLDGSKGYMVGASLKDAGRKGLSVTRIEDVAMVGTVSAALGA